MTIPPSLVEQYIDVAHYYPTYRPLVPATIEAMNLPSSSHNTRLQPSGAAGSEQQYGAHRLTPQEAALRGASLAFQKQQHQAQEGGHTHKTGVGNGGISRQTTGASVSGGRISRQLTGSSVRSQRDFADEAIEKERERERKALFLSSTTTPELSGKSQHLLLPPGARPNAAPTDSKSASFIAATLAASRSVSPGTAGAEGVARRSPLPESAALRRVSSASGVLDELTDTTSLAPTTSLISLFEKQKETDGVVEGSSNRSVKRKPKPRSPKPQFSVEVRDDDNEPRSRALKPQSGLTGNDDVDMASVRSSPKPKSSAKPKLDPITSTASPKQSPSSKSKPVAPDSGAGREAEDKDMDERVYEFRSTPRPSPKPKPRVITRPETPPSPVIRRADTEIVSPKPRRPKTKSRLEDALSSDEANDNSDVAIEKMAKAKPKVPIHMVLERRRKGIPQADQGEQGEQQALQRPNIPSKSPLISVKSHSPAPRKRSGLSERLPPELRRQSIRRQSDISTHDGQEESKLGAGQDAVHARPTTADSKSSNDSFVSASSVPTRDDAESLLTVEALASNSITPKAQASRPPSTQPSTPVPIRPSITGSSQLPLDSLSDAIMAGSLASARHTPISLNDGRTPPPLPPSRRKGGNSSKHKASSRRPSPHRMKHTLRQPKSLSDDEQARRPHHKKGLNHKKHAHHEGSRSRWREEITEREKKRYEAVWASNRGVLLVATQQACSDPDRHPASHQRPRQPLRNESHEELSEHVANVIVRDLWSRSRLPAPELAEVWDLVYGHGRGPGRVLHGALNKQEFVVGMWLIDQRLRGRKIPPRVSDSVWDSAKGLRVLNPDNGLQGHGHGHGHGHKGKKIKAK